MSVSVMKFGTFWHLLVRLFPCRNNSPTYDREAATRKTLLQKSNHLDATACLSSDIFIIYNCTISAAKLVSDSIVFNALFRFTYFVERERERERELFNALFRFTYFVERVFKEKYMLH